MKRQYSKWALLLALMAIYFCGGKLGLSLAYGNKNISAVWPPTGIAIAALLLFGRRMWPAIFFGAFLINFYVLVQGHKDALPPVANMAWTSLGIACGNTAEALIGAWLAARFARGRDAFEHTNTILRFAVLAGIVSTLASATVGVLSLEAGHFANRSGFTFDWLTWWTGDMVSDMVLAPALLIWGTRPNIQWKPGRLIEGLALAALVFMVGEAIFGSWLIPPGKIYAIEYLALLPLLWAARRFGTHGASLAALATSIIAIIGTMNFRGPYAIKGDNDMALLLLQAFIATITLTALVVASVVWDRNRAFDRVHLQHDASRALSVSATPTAGTREILKIVCASFGWDFGTMWRVDAAKGVLWAADVWHAESVGAAEFEETTRKALFPQGQGLPGLIWGSSRPMWIEDIKMLPPGSLRGEAAAKAGFRGAFGFPVAAGSNIQGVMEFFSRQIREPDEELLDTFAALGRQIGQFMERNQAEMALREAQEELSLHAAELEDRVSRRTSELQGTIESLEGFCYSIAHDLRAPLRYMNGFTSLLLEEYSEKFDETGRDYGRRILEASEKMDKLIADLLEYGQLSAADLKLVPVDMDAVAREGFEQLAMEYSASGPKAQVAGPLPTVLAHPAVVRQVMMNLLRNAAKFMPPGVKPQIQVGAELANGRARIWVKDNGIGIDPAYHKKIFGVFQRLHSDKVYPGTGIGLAIVQKGVERMGGRIGLESKPGEGSLFWFELRVAEKK